MEIRDISYLLLCSQSSLYTGGHQILSAIQHACCRCYVSFTLDWAGDSARFCIDCVDKMLQELVKSLPPLKRQWLRLKMYQLHTPFLAIINPEIVESNDKRVAIKVPLNFITRNSWRTMFFAAISAGVDLTGGWAAFDIAEEFKIGVLYKSMKIDFLRRVDGDLTLICEDNQKITQAAEEAAKTGQRINLPVTVKGYCFHYSDKDPCIHSDLILSMKTFRNNPGT